jgi:hypothetical protein
LVYFVDIWSILRLLDICLGLLVYYVVIWYTFPTFGILHQEKSGNPAVVYLPLWTSNAISCLHVANLLLSLWSICQHLSFYI